MVVGSVALARVVVRGLKEERDKIIRNQAQTAKEAEALRRAEFSLEKFIGYTGWVAVSDNNRPFVVPREVNVRPGENAKKHPEYILTNAFILISFEDSR